MMWSWPPFTNDSAPHKYACGGDDGDGDGDDGDGDHGGDDGGGGGGVVDYALIT